MPASTRYWLASLACVFPLLASGAAPVAAPGVAPGALDCASKAQRIDEERFMSIGGIEQWVTIKGASCANPVVLMAHGGPGNPATPFADAVYGAWEKDFTLVQWDQRGAGKTYGRNPRDPETLEQELSVERMAQDGIELAIWLTGYLHKKKVIVFGGSWGSVLAVHMAKARPDLFQAGVITGTLVSEREHAAAGYRKVLELARAAGDTATVKALEAVGAPPWKNPRNPGIVRRATRKYEAKTTMPAPKSWWAPPAQYATAQAEADYTKGEDYSWLQYVGMTGNGMAATVDLTKLGTSFELPMYFIQGAEDLVTVPEISKRYFDAVKAPHKEYVLLPNTGHDPNPPMIEAQYRMLKKASLH